MGNRGRQLAKRQKDPHPFMDKKQDQVKGKSNKRSAPNNKSQKSKKSKSEEPLKKSNKAKAKPIPRMQSMESEEEDSDQDEFKMESLQDIQESWV